MKPLLQKLGITGVVSESEQEYEIALAEVVASRAALERLGEMAEEGLVSSEDRELLAESYEQQEFAATQRVSLLSRSSIVHAARVENARREMLLAQIESLRDEERRGTISRMVSSRALDRLDEALSESVHAREGIEIASMSNEVGDETTSEVVFDDLLPKRTDEVVGGLKLEDQDE